jgi:hypothetical protein
VGEVEAQQSSFAFSETSEHSCEKGDECLSEREAIGQDESLLGGKEESRQEVILGFCVISKSCSGRGLQICLDILPASAIYRADTVTVHIAKEICSRRRS